MKKVLFLIMLLMVLLTACGAISFAEVEANTETTEAALASSDALGKLQFCNRF